MSEVTFSLAIIQLISIFNIILGTLTAITLIVSLLTKSIRQASIFLICMLVTGIALHSLSNSILSDINLESLKARRASIKESALFKADFNKIILDEDLTENERAVKKLMELEEGKEYGVFSVKKVNKSEVLKKFASGQEGMHFELRQIEELERRINEKLRKKGER